MASLIVYEFTNRLDAGGNAVWPNAKRTAVASGGSVITGIGTQYVMVSSDADTNMTFDGSAPTAADVPLLSAVANGPFLIAGQAPRTLRFL